MKVVVNSYAWIEKSALLPSQIDALKAALTIYPKKVGNHPGPAPAPVYLYAEVGNLFGMAREFFFNNRKPHHEVEVRVTEGDKAAWEPLAFAATLREEQAKALQVVRRAYKEESRLGGVVKAPTGWG